ncbi:nucleoside phosphorylase [Thermodesulfobacteriota bacterium]
MDRKIETYESLIRPEKRETDPEIGPDAVMAMIPSDLEYLVKYNREKKINHFNMNRFNLYQVNSPAPPYLYEEEGPDGSEKGEFLHDKCRNGESSLSLSGPFLGAPQSVIGMEKLIALGAKRIWVLGWCGSLNPNLRIGDLLIPTGALSEEGTSRHYPILQKSPGTDEELNGMLERTLRKRKLAFYKGRVWTTDAPYRETAPKVKECRDRGILAVEMEMAALITLSVYRRVKLTGLLTVSDELYDLKWNPGFSNPKLKAASRLAAELVLEIIESLDG